MNDISNYIPDRYFFRCNPSDHFESLDELLFSYTVFAQYIACCAKNN